MEEPISSSIFPEKDNKIEISSKNINIAPRFEDIVDIKKYNNTIDETISTKFIAFCIQKVLGFCGKIIFYLFHFILMVPHSCLPCIRDGRETQFEIRIK